MLQDPTVADARKPQKGLACNFCMVGCGWMLVEVRIEKDCDGVVFSR